MSTKSQTTTIYTPHLVPIVKDDKQWWRKSMREDEARGRGGRSLSIKVDTVETDCSSDEKVVRDLHALSYIKWK